MGTEALPPISSQQPQPNRGAALVSLLQACAACDLRTVTSLLKSATRDKVNGVDSSGMSALHALAQSSATSVPPKEPACNCFGSPVVAEPFATITQALLAAGADPDSENGEGCTPLMLACIRGRLQVIEELLPCSNMKVVNSKGETALMVALRSLNTDVHQGVISRMVKGGAPVNQVAADGQTALMYAATKGRIKAVQLLLDNSAAVNEEDTQGRTALSLAITSKHGAVCVALLEAGAFDTSSLAVNQRVGKCGQTQLHIACAQGKVDRVKQLLAAKAIITAGDDNGQRPLHMCNEGTCATALLNAGADVNVTDSARNTVLHLAARKGNLALVKLFLESEAKTSVQNVHGSSPLHSALEGLCKTSEHKDDKACLAICTLLLEHGADVNAQDNGGYQPLDKAHKVTVTGKVTAASAEILDLLKTNGARLSLTFQCELDIAPGGRMTLLGGSITQAGNISKSQSMNAGRGRGTMPKSISVNKVSPYGGSVRDGSRPAANRLEVIFGVGNRSNSKDEGLSRRSRSRSPSGTGSRRNSQHMASRTTSENGTPISINGDSHKDDVRRFSHPGEKDGIAGRMSSMGGEKDASAVDAAVAAAAALGRATSDAVAAGLSVKSVN